jgi:hypothetical protein
MLLARLDDDLRIANFFDLGGQQSAKLFARLSWNAAGPPIRHDAFLV